MAKLTLTQLASDVAGYLTAAKVGDDNGFNVTKASFTGLLDKIGKQVTIDGLFNDRLPELDGGDLPLGKTIEEWFIDLTLPSTMTATGGVYNNTNLTTDMALDIVPQLPTVEACVYSYSIGRLKIKTTVPYNNFERAMNSATDAGNYAAKILERLQNSYDVTIYQAKRQLIGRMADAAVTASRVKVIAAPSNTSTGEAFIKQVKEDIEEAQFVNTCSLTSGAVIGAVPSDSLILFIKKGYMPILDVDVNAGAFHQESLVLPCKIKVVEDFGDMTNTGVYAFLVDARGLKVYNGYNAIRSSENADGDAINYVRHFEPTAFYSKYVYCKAYKPS